MIPVRVEEVRCLGHHDAVTQWPEVPSSVPGASSSSGPTLSVSALAKRLGVAPSTLRTWDRRYGMGPSVHSRGSHRRYTPRDVLRLECMQRALAAGANPAEAAKHAINTVATHSSESGHKSAECTFEDISVNSTQIAPLSIRPLIAKAVAEGGVVGMWTSVGGPATAGAYGEGTRKAFSEHATGLLSTLLVDAPVGAGLRAQVVAVPGSVPCGIECRALAAALATEGVNTRLVNALDRRALTAVIAAELPDVVVLWIEDVNADPMAVIRALKRRVRGLTFVVGGPCSGPESLPGSVHACETLPEAVATVLELARRFGRRPR